MVKSPSEPVEQLLLAMVAVVVVVSFEVAGVVVFLAFQQPR